MDIKKYVNFSKAGKDSVKKYLYLLTKKKKRKNDFNDIFFFKEKKENDSDENDSYFYHEDIFSKTYNKKISDKEDENEGKIFDIRSTCYSLNKKKSTNSKLLKLRNNIINNNFDIRYDKYKYHLLHHNDNYENIFNKKRYSPSSTKYQPKFEYTYKKIIYSIPFKKVSGRQNKILTKKIIENNKNKLSIFNNSPKNKKITSSNLNNQLLRQLIPNQKDFRINNKQDKENKNNKKFSKIELKSKQNNKRKDSSNSIFSNNFIFTNKELNFIRKKINLEKKQNQQIKKEKFQKNETTIKSNEKKEKNIIISSASPIKNLNHTFIPVLSPNKIFNRNNENDLLLNEDNTQNIDNKKNNILNQTYKSKGINFRKMLSREYLDKINRIKEPIHPMITPNYSSIEPKTIMKVLYSKSKKDDNKRQIIAYNNDFTYDINNIFNKYNNHHYPKKFNLSKMCGRFESEKNTLPVFMLRSFDRNSIDNVNESSLKMNNYANSSFQEIQSSFNEKKTFNARLRLDEVKKENKIMEYDEKYNKNKLKYKKIRYIDEKKEKSQINIIPKNSWWKNKLGEFYKKDYDELGNDYTSSFIGTKVDGITLKLFKSKSKYKNLLSKREKEIFCPF